MKSPLKNTEPLKEKHRGLRRHALLTAEIKRNSLNYMQQME